MAALIKELKVKVPILHIKGRQYLIGLNKCLCVLRGNNVMIRVGGGYETFTYYIKKNGKFFERMLVILMIKSDSSLEAVVNSLINGDKFSYKLNNRLSFNQSVKSLTN